MATAKRVQSRSRRQLDLQEMLTEVGLSVDSWLHKLREDLGVTCATDLLYLEEKDLQKLKSQTQHTWEEKALEKLLDISQPNNFAEFQETPGEMIESRQQQAEQALQELRALQSEGKHREDEEVKKKEAELRQAMEIPEECWPKPEVPLKDVTEAMERHLNHMEQKLSYSRNLPDRDLVKWASGGLALQGIYKTRKGKDQLAKREELLRVPKEFFLFAPEQGKMMDAKEFMSAQAESLFTETVEKLGFRTMISAKSEHLGFSQECGKDQSKQSESMDTQQSNSEHSYFSSVKYRYVPLASFHFRIDQLQLSQAALKELKSIEEQLEYTNGADRFLLLRNSTENFFNRFGSHANQGPLHLGGIYCWKAISEGFQSDQLDFVKQWTAEALDCYITESSRGFEGEVEARMKMSESHYVRPYQNTLNQQLQINVQLSVSKIGGPSEANGIFQWTAGLLANNKTWSVIDKAIRLVPVWRIILRSHKNDFKNPFQVAKCLRENYAVLSGLPTQIQDEEFFSIIQETRLLQKNIKVHAGYDGDVKLKKVIDVCVYKLTNFLKAPSSMEWIHQLESEGEQKKISSFSEFLQTLTEIQKNLEGSMKKKSPQTVEEAQRKATCKVTTAFGTFSNYLREAEQPDLQLLLISISDGSGNVLESHDFQALLGCAELNFLLDEIQTVLHIYQELKTVCPDGAQAFLVLKTLNTTVGNTAISLEEKTEFLALTKKYIEQLLSPKVSNVLTKSGTNHDSENQETDMRLHTDGNCKHNISPLTMDEVKEQLQWLNHENKETCNKQHDENSKEEMIEKGPFLGLLQRLGLEHHYPKMMSKADYHLICKTSVHNSQPASEQELPFYFLQKLLMLDCGFRNLIVKKAESDEPENLVGPCYEEIDTFDPFEELSDEKDEPPDPLDTESQPRIHPMDIQMALFHCADDLARQYILSKLSICQFALPLIVPNPNTSQMEFSLWSFRQIRRSWQESSKSSQEKSYSHRNQQMYCVSTPIVSFIRVGKGFSASKSQIMNSILSKRKHDVFFHRHCRGSSKFCLLMQGVVEISWFCPGGQGEDTFDKCVAFTNLHGDAKDHKQQLSFLQDVSSVIVVLMSSSDDNKENQNIVRHLSQSSIPLLCLLDDKKIVSVNNSGRRVRIGIRNRTEAELTEELTNYIKHLLKRSGTSLSLEDCSQMARKQGFLVDEDQKDCKKAKEKAEIIMALLAKQTLSKIKENLLPLQGNLWHIWCKKDKELYHLTEKGNRSIEQHKSDIEGEKQKIRLQQLEKAFPLNNAMCSFLKTLQENAETPSKEYILTWLSLLLHNLTKEHLEKLQEKQRSLWLLEKTGHRKCESNFLIDQQNQIEAITTEIYDCTFGIEHLLREVAQIYEALEETFSPRDSIILCLPQIAADLMVAGLPIELMDGDASYVPLKWVTAVFDKISEKVGDKRLFVLSILGLQSSGKSTLLNALFGLQFTTSAGRCTKGAYMQLLKVEETFTEELGFDFMLIVDTEGLRAPELKNNSQNWDNELATFVTGLGNLTLINIFGENPAEMQDVLQIVVQAFLRMKQVKISPSCIFVHQNVGEVTAKDQTVEGRRRLEQRLDEMTALAAELEECSDITCFSDVIKFDVKSHIYYFAHLWDGNPPMASPNPYYSYNVQELKNVILQTAQQESIERIMKISDVKFRVQDLWKALVSENFIFNFRNTKEVIAMNKLETIYNHWTWELRSYVLELQNQLNNQIQNSKIKTITTNTLEGPLYMKYDNIKQEFDKYFEEDPESETLVQWKAYFEQKLQMLNESLISDTRRKGNELISLKQTQERLENQISQCENELLERSRELALDVKDKELSDEELREKFEQLWTNWISNVTPSVPLVIDPDIDLDSENILLEQFKNEKNIIERLKKDSGEIFEINYDKHVQMKKQHGLIPLSLEIFHKESIKNVTHNIYSRFNETIKNIQKQQCGYSQNDFHQTLRIIEMELKSVPPEEEYTFTRDYIIDLSLCLFQKASKIFKEMHEAFKIANDPVNYLERKKNDFFMSFKIHCQGATSIKLFVDFFCPKLTSAIYATVEGEMVRKVTGDIQSTCPAFSGNRANLEKHILISLAEEENFEKYWNYIHHPEQFFREYITDHIVRYCSEKEGEKIKTFLKTTLDDIKNAIFSAIQNATAVTKDERSTASRWLDLFCDHLGSNLIFPRRDLISIEHLEIKDTEFLKETMSAALDLAQRKVKEDFSSKPIDKMIPDIEKILSDQLCGCWKQCPFCKAICTNTIPEHEGDHSVSLHRPQAVRGAKWINTEDFVTHFCTSLVASDYPFFVNDVKFFYKKYREAGDNYARWSITPVSSTQPYWKWFVCHFRSDLEEKYGKKFINKGTIPGSWFKITKQEVFDDLKSHN
ncbi:interferon-induced very large GTPase 1-like [Chionomys nivalis]|uniref:interferon-induced very large GTPase 1-like n=1 Tax=Chionomys nivalis TaxID=269649 RepID=UPI002598D89C|nr:interferon-induced very large GTPase 1-like [Chionomys nivalis]